MMKGISVFAGFMPGEKERETEAFICLLLLCLKSGTEVNGPGLRGSNCIVAKVIWERSPMF